MPVDRSRRFALPGIQDLNKDQDEALALPLEGQHLIIGGPGTGKSVVALLRARRLADNRTDYRFLVYNNLLHQSNVHLFGTDKQFVASTWNRWFPEMWREHFEEAVPRREPAPNSTFREIDWISVIHYVNDASSDLAMEGDTQALVIDEGQDMPKEFYEALVNLGFGNFYVVADQNQQLNPDTSSSRQNIENALAINPSDTVELKANYRNTRPIALLAQHFYPADPASPRPNLPAVKPAVTSPELWTYDSAGNPSLTDIVARILQLSDRYPRKLIGVITSDNKVRQKILNAFRDVNPDLDNDKPPVQTFVSGQRNPLNFGQGGIMVINAQSCKGLEFDIAILADIDQHKPKQDIYALKSRFYVMVARGREQVILLRTGNVCPVVESLLPADPAILVRKE